MITQIKKSRAFGTVSAPPSKSIAHRALICGALSGESRLKNIANSVDITATLQCLKQMGADIDTDGDTVKIGGLSPEKIPECELNCCESGSTLRFLIPLCLLSDKKITLMGSKRLLERPLTVYSELCREKGLLFEQSCDGVTVRGPLKSGVYRLSGRISSQFISGLLFALPLCDGDSIIEITDSLESASYIELTLKSLKDFGIDIKKDNNSFIIKGSQRYHSSDHAVEGDWSNAAFLDAFNHIGGDVSVTGLDGDSLQGDRVYRELFRQLHNPEKPIDLTDCPDLAPILFALAAALGGAEFTGTHRLKIKESDRAETMAQELSKFGIKVTVEENTVTVHRGTLKRPDTPLYGHNDHRIVMSLAVLCSITGGTIEGSQAVSKSFPDFFEKIKSLFIGITQYEA